MRVQGGDEVDEVHDVPRPLKLSHKLDVAGQCTNLSFHPGFAMTLEGRELMHQAMQSKKETDLKAVKMKEQTVRLKEAWKLAKEGNEVRNSSRRLITTAYRSDGANSCVRPQQLCAKYADACQEDIEEERQKERREEVIADMKRVRLPAVAMLFAHFVPY